VTRTPRTPRPVLVPDPRLRLTLNGQPVEATVHLLWWQTQGRSFTRSGCGSRIPTQYMIRRPGETRWRRVYCYCFSNSGTCFIGRSLSLDQVVA
jgi:hypothetical protein